MGLIYWLLALACTPFPESDLLASPCEHEGDEVCCSWVYQVNPGDLIVPIWAAERQCIDASELTSMDCRPRRWRYDDIGADYYEVEPTVRGLARDLVGGRDGI